MGDLTYSKFAGGNGTGNPTGVAIPASSITVTPITTPGNEGLQCSSGRNVTTNQDGTSSFQDNLLTFVVIGSLNDLHLTFNGAFQGTGVAGVAEGFCLNQTTGTAGCPQGSSGVLNVTNPPGIFNSDLTFTGSGSSRSVSKGLHVNSCLNGHALL